MISDKPVTVVVTGAVPAAQEGVLDGLLKEFVPQWITSPGNLGVHVVKSKGGRSLDYHTVIRFTTQGQLEQFRREPQYQHFRQQVERLFLPQPRIDELTGLESWFTLPGSPALRPLPRWKMLVVTVLGVYPTSLLIGGLILTRLEALPGWIRALISTLIMVAALTFVVMPLLTRLFQFWLYPQQAETGAGRAGLEKQS